MCIVQKQMLLADVCVSSDCQSAAGGLNGHGIGMRNLFQLTRRWHRCFAWCVCVWEAT